MFAWSEAVQSNLQPTKKEKILTLVLFAIAVVAFVATIALRNSLEYGRLSVPPTYDDVTYLYWSQSVLHDAAYQSPLVTAYQLLDQHSPLTTLFGVVGYSLIKSGDIGPYIVGASHLIVFIVACVLVLRRLPALAVVGIVSAIGAIPALRNFAAEFRPEPAWASLTAAAAIAFFAVDIFECSRWRQIGLGLLAGIAVISKPTTSPFTLIVLGSAFIASGLAQYYEKRRAGSPPPFRLLVSGAATIWAAALVVIVPVAVVIGAEIYQYITWVMVGISDQVRSRDGFRDQLLFYSFGAGGQVMLGRALPVLLGVWGLGLVYAALWRSRALPRILAICIVILISYAIPTASPVKLVWFGTAFDAILVLGTLYLVALLYEPFAGLSTRTPVLAAVSVVIAAVGIGLLLQANKRGAPSMVFNIDAASRIEVTDRTARIWEVLRDHELARLGSNPPGHVSNVMTIGNSEPIVGFLLSLYGAKENLPIRDVDYSYARSVDELISNLPGVDYVIVGPSHKDSLSGPGLGDALRDAMKARSDFSLVASLPLRNPGAAANIYERTPP
jgi:hypothetical protein